MPTKKDLEQKISDLQSVLSAVQDEREDLRARLNDLKGSIAERDFRIDKLLDEVSELSNIEPGEEAREEIGTLKDTVASLEDENDQLHADKTRLLSLCGMTERDFDLSAGSVLAAIGKA
jgi:chromosome segregation ATPase